MRSIHCPSCRRGARVARVNPLSYEVDALRALMIAGGSSSFGLVTDYALLTGSTALLVVVASYVYPRVVA